MVGRFHQLCRRFPWPCWSWRWFVAAPPVMGYAFAYQPVFMDRRYFRGDLHCHGHFHDPETGSNNGSGIDGGRANAAFPDARSLWPSWYPGLSCHRYPPAGRCPACSWGSADQMAGIRSRDSKSCEPCARTGSPPVPAARHQGRGAPCGESFWHWALGADGGHGHAQPPFRSSRLIGAERQPTSDCRQSLQQSLRRHAHLALVHTSIEHSRDWCRSLLILNCQELAAQQPLRPINWCSRLLKMTLFVYNHEKW